MAEHGLTGATLPPAARRLLEQWLEQLAAALPTRARLRARIVEELDDGLRCAAERRLAAGADPLDAARAALAEFGPPGGVAAAFRDELVADRARRTGLALVVTGPLAGLAWLAALAPPPWPPDPAGLLGSHPLALVALVVAVPAALVAIAAAGPAALLPLAPQRAARAAVVAALACAAGDCVLLAALARAALAAPATLTWAPAVAAATAGVARLALAVRAARRCTTGPVPAGR